jgi:poly-gamma-glutamate synthesis protein (capsule biosynthesis protein)
MAINLFACGDFVNVSGKSNFVDKKLQSIISGSDLAICNFEAPIKIQDMNPIKKAGPHLSQSKNSIKYLKQTGFNIVSLANNHIYDFGQSALNATIKELRKNEIDFIGGGENFAEAYEIKIIEKNNLRIGILAGCENEFGCLFEKKHRGGYAWIFNDLIEDNILRLKHEVDFVVLIAHAGVENIQIPIKEWRERYKRLCKIGVDVVIGHHPHVPQGFEEFNNSLIFYSLGNFYFDTAPFENKSNDSFSVVFHFERAKKTVFDLFYHKMIDGQTRLLSKEDVSFDLEQLNTLLGEGYEQLNDDISLNLFNKYYYNYYKTALGCVPNKNNLLKMIKHIIKKFFKKDSDIDKNNLLLLHNIRIESHRFLVQRALSLISEKVV